MIMHLWSRTAVADKEGLTSKIGPYDTGLPSKPVVRWQRYDQRFSPNRLGLVIRQIERADQKCNVKAVGRRCMSASRADPSMISTVMAGCFCRYRTSRSSRTLPGNRPWKPRVLRSKSKIPRSSSSPLIRVLTLDWLTQRALAARWKLRYRARANLLPAVARPARPCRCDPPWPYTALHGYVG